MGLVTDQGGKVVIINRTEFSTVTYPIAFPHAADAHIMTLSQASRIWLTTYLDAGEDKKAAFYPLPIDANGYVSTEVKFSYIAAGH